MHFRNALGMRAVNGILADRSDRFYILNVEYRVLGSKSRAEQKLLGKIARK